ncbi:MAG: aromatic ring-hydroxylating dioxygenase subunit alpha, partial [Alphaproteobacteria bacterium]
AAMSAQIEAGFIEAFSEDVDIIESVQAGLNRYPHLTPVNLAIDGGPVRARRVIEELVATETDGKQVRAAE